MITKDNNLKIMELFFKYPYRQFHIREIARLTGLSSTGVIKIVKRLEKGGLLISRKEAVTEEIKPDFGRRFFIMKRLYNIYSLYDSGLIEAIKNFYEQPSAIILFGSYGTGMDTEKSDIDIAVIAGAGKMPELHKFEAKLARKISIYIIDMAKTPIGFKNSLANGIILEGFVEFLK